MPPQVDVGFWPAVPDCPRPQVVRELCRFGRIAGIFDRPVGSSPASHAAQSPRHLFVEVRLHVDVANATGNVPPKLREGVTFENTRISTPQRSRASNRSSGEPSARLYRSGIWSLRKPCNVLEIAIYQQLRPTLRAEPRASSM